MFTYVKIGISVLVTPKKRGQVPFHLAMVCGMWKDMYAEIQRKEKGGSSTEDTSPPTYQQWSDYLSRQSPVDSQKRLTSLLGLRFPDDHRGFLVHCVLKGRQTTSAVLPLEQGMWQVVHHGQYVVASQEKLLHYAEEATDHALLASFHLTGASLSASERLLKLKAGDSCDCP